MIGSILCISLSLFVLGTDAAWHQVWEDDFNGGALNDADWTYQEDCNGGGNGELQCYTAHKPDNVKLEGGHLVIHVKVEESKGKHFTSGRVLSKKAWTFGKFEARAKMPKGKHLWPAIWMMPQKSTYGVWAASGEIDIMEYRGERPNQIMGTIHYGASWPNNINSGSGEKTYPSDFSADWHTYGVEWEANEIRWYVDGNEYHKENIHRNMYSGKGTNPYTKPGQPFDQPFYWILNVAVGGGFFPASVFGPEVTPAEAKKLGQTYNGS